MIKTSILKVVRAVPWALAIFTARYFWTDTEQGANFFLTCVTADTLHTSLEYAIRGYASADEHPLGRRYIYFGLVNAIYLTTRFILWSDSTYWIKSIYFVAVTPRLMDRLLEPDASSMFAVRMIRTKIIRILKRVLCDQLTRISNHIANHLLHLNVLLTHQDLGLLVENIDRKSLGHFAKSVIKATITHTVETNYAIAHYIARLYSGGILSDIGLTQNTEFQTKKRQLKGILYSRDWEKLSDPTTVRLFIQLYDPEDQTVGLFVRAVTDATMKCTCCISLGSFVGSQIVATLISFIFYYRRQKSEYIPFTFSYVRLAGLIAGAMTGSFALNGIFCEFGDMLKLDKVGVSIVKMTRREVIPDNFNVIFLIFPLLLYLITRVVGSWLTLFALITVTMPSPTTIGFKTIFESSITTRRLFLVYALGWFSGFSFIHLVGLSVAMGLIEKAEVKPEKYIEETLVIDKYMSRVSDPPTHSSFSKIRSSNSA